jgi:hypothetical protein
LDRTVGLTAELADAVGIPVRRSGSLELIRAAEAGRLLDECAKERIRILGLEGFRLAGDETRPDMSVIADLSDVEDPAASVEEARAVVAETEKADLMLEFSLTRSAG